MIRKIGCLITSNALDHWRQPVESELTADFQSDWQAQLGGNGDTSGVSRMVLHQKGLSFNLLKI